MIYMVGSEGLSYLSLELFYNVYIDNWIPHFVQFLYCF
jgi:hypothetical protein